MQTNLTMRHGHLSEETQERILAKTEKLPRHFERLSSIELIVDLQDASKPQVELLVSSEHKHDFVSHVQSDNLLTAVEQVVHKMEQQLRKYKERTIEKHRDPEVKRLPTEQPDE
ncbi:ribosome hibernation-promoting factor, HPF/YfiA family [Botrimarina hoheduenensis]|uniref:Sigma 54 modulation protein / S30EA ribosomal protein n=1 Tax=Botrimarina hoheduenensis TaxID=2528000 RepID=A0A5C5W943_9BACT|nr:ribosome-associated translation inhibitor RaiA [Botrimarina hoheduenensis]TWT46531.1 Sigma 54 modulation protein / S30EA ribosomal protein [Botrimarina hoheduenensis]